MRKYELDGYSVDELSFQISEAVIMSYQGEGNAVHCTRTFHETLDWYLNKADYSDYFYTDNKVPKMGDVRGKIVLLNFRGYGRSDGTQVLTKAQTKFD